MNGFAYNFKGNKKDLSKDLGNAVWTLNPINPYQPLSDIDGYVIIDYKKTVEGETQTFPQSANYVVMMNKNYFITDRELLTGGKIKLYLRVDVLSTYVDDIKVCPCVVARSELDIMQNSYIVDGLRNTYAKREVISYVIGNIDYSNATAYTLITVG